MTVIDAPNVQKYRDDILAPVVLPFMQAGNGVTILQQDNARPHAARATTQFLAANDVNVMEWPSMSPDFSPIEHIWDELDRRVRARPNQPTNLPQLQATLLQDQEWNNLPNNIVLRYIRFMRNLCRAVINSIVGHPDPEKKILLAFLSTFWHPCSKCILMCFKKDRGGCQAWKCPKVLELGQRSTECKFLYIRQILAFLSISYPKL